MTDAARQARHELRTPVNHILSYARLVLEEADELALDDDVEAGLDTIQAAGHQALTLIDALLERSGPAERQALLALAEQIAEQADRLRAAVAAAGHEQATEDVGRIAEAARRLLSLTTEPQALIPQPPPLRGANIGCADVPTVGEGETDALLPSPAAGRGAGGEGRPEDEVHSSTLLVVDDDEANRDVLARSLARLGYHVLRAEDGRAALDVLASTDVDLVLLDIMMPVLDGYAVLERRRDDPRLRAIPFIVISATGDDASVIRCIELGAEDYLPKPFDPVLLRARIGACLEKKRLYDQEQQHLATIQAQAAALAEWNQTLEQRVAEQVTRLERLNGLKRFLPSQVAERIADTGDASLLASHRRQIAVVFCDLRGFTPFSTEAEPEEIMEVLAEYHAAMGALISQHEGTVEHFAGDGLMVVFNDPFECPDPEARAVTMAVQMRDRMAELCRAWRRRRHVLGFGVGISFGWATLGQIGFEGRFHYAAIGNVVNLAARLCGEAKDGQILASERVGLAVEELAEVAPAGSLTLKGIAHPESAFEIVGLK